jgi:mycofactocin precursor
VITAAGGIVAEFDVPSATQRLAPVPDPDEPSRAAGGVVLAAEPSADDLIAGELLVEEVSIDGMCGVY